MNKDWNFGRTEGSAVELFGDGWYTLRQDADECLAHVEGMGGRPIGIIESRFGTWGILYWADRVLFDNHHIDSHSALVAVARKAEARQR